MKPYLYLTIFFWSVLFLLVAASFKPHETRAGFGIQAFGYITGYVWNDQNGNQTKDVGETNISGIQVSYSGPQSGNMVTNSDPNNYLFGDGVTTLVPGLYSVTSGVPANMILTTTNNPISNIDVAEGETEYANFGFRDPPEITGRICEDTNTDGICQNGEPNYSATVVTMNYTTPAPGVPDSVLSNAVPAPGFNYTTDDDLLTNPLFPGANTIEIVLPPGKVLSGTQTALRAKTLIAGEQWVENYALIDAGPAGGTIAGYVWDDSVDRTDYLLTVGSEDLIPNTSAVFSIEVLDGLGGSLGSVPTQDATGNYAILGIPVGNDREVRITMPVGYCDGGAVGDDTGFNDGTTGGPYATSSPPVYGTGTVISVAEGVTTTVNLGAITDYRVAAVPPGNQNLPSGAGSCVTWNYTIEPDPCWVGGLVDVDYTPEPSWPATLTFSTVPATPVSVEPNLSETVSLQVCDPTGGTPPGAYDFDLDVTNTGDPDKDIHTTFTVYVNLEHWIQVSDGDVWSGYREFSQPGIDYTTTTAPVGGYTKYLLDATDSNWNQASPDGLGGLPLAWEAIEVDDGAGGDAHNERDWKLEDYTGSYVLDYETSDFSGVTTDCNFTSLPAGGSCRFTGNELPSTNYQLTGIGVALVYANPAGGTLEIEDDFVRDAGSPLGKVLLVVNGALKIKHELKTEPPDKSAPPNIEALIIVLGDNDVTIESEGDTQVKILGGLYFSGLLTNNRVAVNAPSLYIQSDPFYLMHSVDILSQSVVYWRDVSPRE